MFHGKILPLRDVFFGLFDYHATIEVLAESLREDLSFVGGSVLNDCNYC